MNFKKHLSRLHRQIPAVLYFKHLPIFYAQFGEDQFLAHLFAGDQKGIYVDVGAHHPFRYSNTAYLYTKGWSGVNIDAEEQAIDMLKRYRANDINLCEVIGDEDGKEVSLTRFVDHAVTSADPEHVARWEQSGAKIVAHEKRQLRRLGTLLEEYLDIISPDRKIDYMNIDVEGMTLQVLRSNDWDKFAPRIVSAEVEGAYETLEDMLASEVCSYMKNLEYNVIAAMGPTIFFKRKA